MFRGREISHADLGWKLLQKVIQTLEGVAVLERPALMEGRQDVYHSGTGSCPEIKTEGSSRCQS